MSSNRRGIVKESQVELSVPEGGNFWFIEVLTHLKIDVLMHCTQLNDEKQILYWFLICF